MKEQALNISSEDEVADAAVVFTMADALVAIGVAADTDAADVAALEVVATAEGVDVVFVVATLTVA